MRAGFRVVVLFLVIAVGGGSALFDICLINCHSDASAKNALSGHCHSTSTSSGAHLRAIAPCCHDATSSLIDSTTQSLIQVRSFVALPPAAALSFDPPAPTRIQFASHPAVSSAHTLIRPPLRV